MNVSGENMALDVEEITYGPTKPKRYFADPSLAAALLGGILAAICVRRPLRMYVVRIVHGFDRA